MGSRTLAGSGHHRRAAFALLLLSACTSWQARTAPTAAGASDTASLGHRVRVETSSGASYELVDAAVVHDSVVGLSAQSHQRVALALSDVRSTQTRRFSALRTTGLVVGLGAVAFVIALAAAVAAVGNFQ